MPTKRSLQEKKINSSGIFVSVGSSLFCAIVQGVAILSWELVYVLEPLH